MQTLYPSALSARKAQLRGSVSTTPFVAYYWCPTCEKPHHLGALSCPHCGEPLAQKAA